jgi:outer membrane protein TolC
MARADEQAQLAQAALNFQRGHPQADSVVLAAPDTSNFLPLETESGIEIALQQRPDLRAAHEKLAAAGGEVSVARSGFLPQIGLVGRYDWNDDQLLGNHGESWAVIGQAKLNLFRGGADRYAWQKAALDAQAGEEDVRHFEEGVQLEVRQALADRASAELRHDAAQTALTAGRENLRVTEARYAQGIARMTDLLDAQTALRELELRELSARYDQQLADYRIRFATGQPLLNE